MIALIFAICVHLFTAAAWNCALDECPLLPEGFAGVGILLALPVLTGILGFFVTRRTFSVRQVWPLGFLSSAALVTTLLLKGDLARPSDISWMHHVINLLLGSITLLLILVPPWIGLLVGEVRRRRKEKELHGG